MREMGVRRHNAVVRCAMPDPDPDPDLDLDARRRTPDPAHSPGPAPRTPRPKIGLGLDGQTNGWATAWRCIEPWRT